MKLNFFSVFQLIIISEFETVLTVLVTSDRKLDPDSREILELTKLSIPIIFETKEPFKVPDTLKQIEVVEELEDDTIDTPYILLLHNNFDFDKEDANLERMVRIAENQNADIVTGSFQNKKGQWDHRKKLIIIEKK